MLALSIAQLGSDEIDQNEFARIVVKETIKQILPIALRRAAKHNSLHAEALEAAAQTCEKEGTRASALKARDVALLFIMLLLLLMLLMLLMLLLMLLLLLLLMLLLLLLLLLMLLLLLLLLMLLLMLLLCC